MSEKLTTIDKARAAVFERGSKRRISRKKTVMPTGALWAWRISLLAIIIIVWELGSGRFISELSTSRPTAIAARFWGWVTDLSLFEHSWVTFQATIIGFVVGAVGGALAGYATATFIRVGEVIEPAMTALYTMPRLALAPLFILWFGLGMQFRVLFAAQIVFFLVYYNTYFGVKDVKADLIASVEVMGGKKLTVATRVIVPSALVWIAAGLKISVPNALLGVVVGEMLASGEGLGFLLTRSAMQFDAAGTFAAIIVLMVIALSLDRLLEALTRRLLHWRTVGQTS